MWQHYLNLLGVQQRTCSTPGQLFLLERGSEPSTHAHLALDQLVVPLYLEYIAHLAAHGTLGTVVAVTARAVERSVLHSQLWAIGGFTCKVHTAGEERNRSVRGSSLAKPLHSCCKVKTNGLPLQSSWRLRLRRERRWLC